MSYLINLMKGVGSISFGMTPSHVRNILGDNYVSFKRTPASSYPCDHFESLGVFVYYTELGVVEAIELSKPAQAILDDEDLLHIPFSKLKNILESKDSQLEIEPDSLTSYTQGIGAYAPDSDEFPERPVESIIIFEENYYS
ncbi:ABC transporter ATP-binding protein [Vibrio natriegens]|uniref:ABC transporter ATP-binding protein n=1 Tax=Vibrio natriegens TaxID=691 RepID=UPI001EFCBF9B|nr:ABC transporter ATP-binding protein [Vibrio natriegens]MCG9703106.1 ABC transporter ATP-binding protein [Vibrio natriegens]